MFDEGKYIGGLASTKLGLNPGGGVSCLRCISTLISAICCISCAISSFFSATVGWATRTSVRLTSSLLSPMAVFPLSEFGLGKESVGPFDLVK